MSGARITDEELIGFVGEYDRLSGEEKESGRLRAAYSRELPGKVAGGWLAGSRARSDDSSE